MLELQEQPAKIVNHNPRPERHGDEWKLAGDIKLAVNVRAAALDAIDPAIRPFLFRERREGDSAVQQDIEGKPGDAEISRRLPLLEPLSLKEKFPGYTLTVVKGMGLTDPIKLPKRELKNFEIEALDNGLAKLTFTASGTYDTNAVSGELDGLQQREVEITLEPPKADAVAEPQQGDLVSGPKAVLVTGIEIETSSSTPLQSAKIGLAGGNDITVGEWAYRPELTEIAVKIHEATGAEVEFTPAVRSHYEAETARSAA